MAIAKVTDVRNSCFIEGSPAFVDQLIDYGDVIETYDISKGLEESFMSIDQNDDGYLSIKFLAEEPKNPYPFSIRPHCKVIFESGGTSATPNTVLLDSNSKYVTLYKPKSKKEIARVMKTSDGIYGGSVKLKPAGETSFTKIVKSGMPIYRGDSIKTEDPDYPEDEFAPGAPRFEGAFAMIIWVDDKSVSKITQDTEIQFIASPSKRTVTFKSRDLWKMTKDKGKNTFLVATPASVGSVKG